MSSPDRSPRPIEPHRARVAVVEDDALLAELLVMALQQRLNPAELRCFSHGQAGVDYCRTTQPDLVIVDLGLPDMDGRRVIRALHTASPASRILVLTGQATPTLPSELLALGVSGYVEKTSSLDETFTAIRRVLSDGLYFSSGTRPGGPRALSLPVNGVIDVPPETLTPREREIVRLVAGGMTSKEIALRVKLSPRTIEKSRAKILQKLDLRDLPALVRWSVKHGLG